MTSTEQRVFVNISEQELELTKEKAIAKSKFTLYRNRLLLMIERQVRPVTELDSAYRKMDAHMETSMAKLSEIYIKSKQLHKGSRIVNEMEMLQDEFHSAYDIAWKSRNLCRNDKSNMASTNQLQGKYSMEEVGWFQSKEKSTERICSPDVHSIKNDLWMQLIPIFSGDKRKYRNWKAVFMACVDTAPATGEYKLLQLRQCLSGEALSFIENLGHSATAYEAAKDRLERKYGGKRRQVAIYLDDRQIFTN